MSSRDEWEVLSDTVQPLSALGHVGYQTLHLSTLVPKTQEVGGQVSHGCVGNVGPSARECLVLIESIKHPGVHLTVGLV